MKIKLYLIFALFYLNSVSGDFKANNDTLEIIASLSEDPQPPESLLLRIKRRFGGGGGGRGGGGFGGGRGASAGRSASVGSARSSGSAAGGRSSGGRTSSGGFLWFGGGGGGGRHGGGGASGNGTNDNSTYIEDDESGGGGDHFLIFLLLVFLFGVIIVASCAKCPVGKPQYSPPQNITRDPVPHNPLAPYPNFQTQSRVNSIQSRKSCSTPLPLNKDLPQQYISTWSREH